jgi:hypothetical protein
MQRSLDCFFPATGSTSEPDFHNFSTHEALIASETLPSMCKSIQHKHLARTRTLQQAIENNTTLTVWLLPRQIPGVCERKVRESNGRDQNSGSRATP